MREKETGRTRDTNSGAAWRWRLLAGERSRRRRPSIVSSGWRGASISDRRRLGLHRDLRTALTRENTSAAPTRRAMSGRRVLASFFNVSPGQYLPLQDVSRRPFHSAKGSGKRLGRGAPLLPFPLSSRLDAEMKDQRLAGTALSARGWRDAVGSVGGAALRSKRCASARIAA